MKVLVFIIFSITFRYCISEVNESYRLCNEILELGRHLPIIFEELPMSQRDKVVEDIRQYNAKMRQFGDMVRNDSDNMQQPLTCILKEGYPKYLGIEIPSDKLKQSFNWTDKDVDRLEALKRATYLEYGDLVTLHDTPMKYIG